MPSPLTVLSVLQNTLYMKHLNINVDEEAELEGAGLQASQGFGSHYSNLGSYGDQNIDFPNTDDLDTPYQTNVAIGLPSSNVGVSGGPLSGDAQNKGFPNPSRLSFPQRLTKEQGIPGVPDPTPEDQAPPPEGAAPMPMDQGVMQPGMEQPGAEQGGEMQPGMEQPGMEQPGMDQTGMMQPGMPGMENIDPVTGLPIKPPSELGRIYELKKIYSRLTTIEAYLSDSTDQELLKLRTVVAQAIELFEILASNLQSYKDQVDDIIVTFYKFLDEVYSTLSDYYKDKSDQKEEDRVGTSGTKNKIDNKKELVTQLL
jgi:DNA-binding ferritin-like protein (Dps family)